MKGLVSYGCTRSFGGVTYQVSGYDSAEDAEFAVMSIAQDEGFWSPPKIRTRPWQFWRPTEHTDMEKRLIARAEEAAE